MKDCTPLAENALVNPPTGWFQDLGSFFEKHINVRCRNVLLHFTECECDHLPEMWWNDACLVHCEDDCDKNTAGCMETAQLKKWKRTVLYAPNKLHSLLFQTDHNAKNLVVSFCVDGCSFSLVHTVLFSRFARIQICASRNKPRQ